MNYKNWEVAPPRLGSVTGRFKLGGKWFAVDTAGHLINMLIAGSFSVVDHRRFINNIRVKFSQFRLDSANIVEYSSFDRTKVWHSYYDYETALYVYIGYCKWFRLPVNVWAVWLWILALKSLRREIPRLLTHGI